MLVAEKIQAENENLKEVLSRRDAELQGKETELQSKESEITQLKLQIAYLKKKLFGTGKSEKFNAAQLELLLGKVADLESKLEEEIEVPAHKRKTPSTGLSREEKYEHLPVEEIVEIIPDAVKEDPDDYERINSDESTFEVDYHPPKFFRRKIVRPKFRLKSDRSKPPVIAPAPARVVEGIPSANLLALIMVTKYMDHQPLNRQMRIYKRYGCTFSVESMVRWVEKVAAWLKPIYDYMSWQLLQGNYLQADETPIIFCDPDLGLKKSKQGYFCAYSRPGSDVVFIWRTGRAIADLTTHLKGFKGLLHTDMYAAYISYAGSNKDITLLACFAHARRYFAEIIEQSPRACILVLKLIGKLYAIEKQIRENEKPLTHEEIKVIRQEHCPNILARLKRLLLILQSRTRSVDALYKPVNYSLRYWDYLVEYSKHGECEIDNNHVENTFRPTAQGKKNWMFIGHPNAGQRSAVIYSIMTSCRHLDINPIEYLQYILTQDTHNLSREQIARLTPSAYANDRRELLSIG